MSFLLVIGNVADNAKKYGISVEGDDFEALFCQDSKVMLLPDNCTFGVMAHEIVHAKNYIMKRAGVKLDVDNDELEAYMVMWLTDKIVNLLIKHKQVIDSKR